MLVSQAESRSNFLKSVREIYYLMRREERGPDETDGVCRTKSEDLSDPVESSAQLSARVRK